MLSWNGNYVFLSVFDGGCWRGISENTALPKEAVTYWTPLPPPPGETAAKPKTGHGFTAAIAAYTDNIQLREVIDAYLEMRMKNKMVMTERAVKMLLKRLSSVAATTEDRIAVAENATLGAWKSFYELPPSHKKAAANSGSSSYDLAELDAMLNQSIF